MRAGHRGSAIALLWAIPPEEGVHRSGDDRQFSILWQALEAIPHSLGIGNPVFLATNKYNLQVTIERWPKVGFHATREHGERLGHRDATGERFDRAGANRPANAQSNDIR